MRLGKKGVVYSFIMVLILVLIFTSFMSLREPLIKEKTYAASKAIKSLDEKLYSMEEDIERGIYIVSFRAFLSLDDILIAKGTYLPNTEEVFSEVFINGTYKNAKLPLMNATSFNNFTKLFSNALLEDNIIVDLIPLDVKLSQDSSWQVEVSVDLTINVTDITKLATWHYNTTLSTTIAIVEFNDPLYIIGSNGFVLNQFARTNVSGFVSGNDVSNLSTHLNNSFYIASTTAPSYIKRLEGDFSPDPNGIESLVNLEEFKDQGLSLKNRSVVDYIYFSNSPILNQTKIQFMPGWFRLDRDDSHTIVYEAESLAIS